MAYSFEDEEWDEEKNEARRRRNSAIAAEASPYHSVPEDMDELEKVMRFLTSGDALMERCAVASLPDVLRSHGIEALRAMQLWLAEMTAEDDDLDSAAPVLTDVIAALESVVPSFASDTATSTACKETMVLCLSPFILQVLGGSSSSQDEETISSVLNILTELVAHMDISTTCVHRERFKSFLKQLTNLALSKGGVSESVHSRVTCCRLLGLAMGKQASDGERISLDTDNEVLSKVTELCQDTEYVTRIEMCRQLPAVVAAVGHETSHGVIVPELLELARDEDTKVRFEAILAATAILGSVDAEHDSMSDAKGLYNRGRGGGDVTATPSNPVATGTPTVSGHEAEAALLVGLLLPAVRTFAETFTARDVSTEARLATELPRLMRPTLRHADGTEQASMAEGYISMYNKMCASTCAGVRSQCAAQLCAFVDALAVVSVVQMKAREVDAVGNVSSEKAAESTPHEAHFDIVSVYNQLCCDESIDVRCEAVKHLPDVVARTHCPDQTNTLLKLFLKLLEEATRECEDIEHGSGRGRGGNGNDGKEGVVGTAGLARSSIFSQMSATRRIVGQGSNAPEPSVTSSLLPILAKSILSFETTLNDQRERVSADLVPAVLQVERHCTLRWRHRLAVLDTVLEVATSSQLLQAEAIEEHFLPLAMSYLDHTTAEPLRQKAMEMVPALIRRIVKRSTREDIEEQLIQNFAKSQSCYRRKTFAQLAGHLISANSSMYFKRIYIDATLALAHDPVPGVRLEICMLLPRLKMAITMPLDLMLMERLGSAMSSLMIDLDPYVANASAEMATMYRRIQVRSSTAAAAAGDASGATANASAMSPEQARFEEEDARKMREEDEFLRDESGGSSIGAGSGATGGGHIHVHGAGSSVTSGAGSSGYSRRTHDGVLSSSRSSSSSTRPRPSSSTSASSESIHSHTSGGASDLAASGTHRIKSVRDAAYAAHAVKSASTRISRRRSWNAPERKPGGGGK